jgi:polyisoprenoid-binding protein YceI
MMIKRLTLSCLAFALCLASVSTVDAQAREYTINNGRATFASDAPLEEINGVSQRVSGSFQLDPASLAGTTGTVQVPVASIRTGIELRDEHLQGANWLNASAHPNLTLEVTGIEGATSLEEGGRADCTIVGRMTVRGTTRPVRVRARAQMRDGAISVRARWRIQLSDFGVSIPAAVQAKVANEITLSVNIRASAG